MADQFVSEIRMFACNFAPLGWSFCNGQLLPIAQNTALFSLLGTTYGGNGTTNFALPDLQGKAPVFFGQGPGLTARSEGETGGSDTSTLLLSQIPQHNHSLMSKPAGGQADPNGRLFGSAGGQLPPPNFYSTAAGTPVQMSSLALNAAGSSLPHNNLMPYLVLNFCIALQGIFPARN